MLVAWAELNALLQATGKRSAPLRPTVKGLYIGKKRTSYMRLIHHFTETLVGVMLINLFASYGTCDAISANNWQLIRGVVHRN